MKYILGCLPALFSRGVSLQFAADLDKLRRICKKIAEFHPATRSCNRLNSVGPTVCALMPVPATYRQWV